MKLLSVSGINLSICNSEAQSLADAQGNTCRCCGAIGLPVRAMTMRNMVRDNLQSFISDAFYFCTTPDCEVAYFDNESNRYFTKDDLRVRIGIKETEYPVPVCYCAGVTEADILRAVVEEGCSTLDDIKRHTGACTRHECQRTNPSGRCCGEQVKRTIEKGLAIREENADSVRTAPDADAKDQCPCCQDHLDRI